MADILRRAAFRFPNGLPADFRNERLATLWSSLPQTDEFRDLDADFFAYADDLSGLPTTYKGEFPDDFPQVREIQ